MKRFTDVTEDFRECAMNYFPKKKNHVCSIVTLTTLLTLIFGALAFLYLKYKKDQDYFDEYDDLDDFELDDDVLYAKDNDIEE
ncbi:MAG: hypothetical protein FWF57_04020 [Defluviitaleaceae bacterium]|nr:hypothetical protein [Defluviitaleaceae bacterium]